MTRLTSIRDEHCRLILEILANSWEIDKLLDSETGKQLLRADTRQLQDLWAVRCAGSQNDFLARLRGLDLLIGSFPRNILNKT
jgi:hypothetical protein